MKNKIFNKLVTTAVVALTTLASFSPLVAFADDNTATAQATNQNSVKVAINKTLNIAEGITTPNATFRFTFTPKAGTSSNNAPYQVASTSELNKGYIPERQVSYTKNDTATSGQIKKDTGDIFAGVSYDRAGEYVYEVAETPNTYTTIKDKADQPIDAVNYDTRKYDMHVIVKNKDNGTYISSVYFKEISGTSSASSAKKEPSESGGTNATYKYDLFENTYTKDAGKIDATDPKDPNDPTKDTTDKTAKALTITKTVTGDLGDKTKDFAFSISITLPATNATAVSPVKEITVNHGGSQQTVRLSEAGTATYDFTLKHGESFTIDNLPAGSKYSVVETGVAGYTPSAVYKENGTEKSKPAGTTGQNYSVENVLVGEKTNDNTVTNNFEDVTPTGLLINNLPFILMIGLGLVGFLTLSRKRRI